MRDSVSYKVDYDKATLSHVRISTNQSASQELLINVKGWFGEYTFVICSEYLGLNNELTHNWIWRMFPN